MPRDAGNSMEGRQRGKEEWGGRSGGDPCRCVTCGAGLSARIKKSCDGSDVWRSRVLLLGKVE